MVNFFFGGGVNKKLLKHVFGLYSLPIIFCQHAMKTVIFILKFGCNLHSEAYDVYVRREYSL